ncbi:MAG: hypothetical protein M3452_03275 [Chloroflexota bacterium]|nr:hypothetical protein [Chloroflexota bacterium]
MTYYEIAADHVDAAARHVAHQTLIVACRDLGNPGRAPTRRPLVHRGKR